MFSCPFLPNRLVSAFACQFDTPDVEMPTIRVDNQVMVKLKELAVLQGNVLGTPNDVMRSVLELGSPVTRQGRRKEPPVPQDHIDIEMGPIRGRKDYHLIPVRKRVRRFFP